MASMSCERQTFMVLAYERMHSLLLLHKLQSKSDCCPFAQWYFTNKQARRVSSVFDRPFIESYAEALGRLYACDCRTVSLLDLQVRPSYAGPSSLAPCCMTVRLPSPDSAR